MRITRRDWLSVGAVFGGLSLRNHVLAQPGKAKGHVVLLGDSIFDNKVYVDDGPAVIDQVRSTLGKEWAATLLAVDGSVTGGVVGQMEKLPQTATHLVISVGGNDALINHGILTAQDPNATATYFKLSEIQREFDAHYKAMIAHVVDKHKRIAVCTIYDPNYVNAQQNQIASAALSVFNDRITRIAFAHGLPVIDLRLLFSGTEHYANSIEPGPKGGAKIAEQIQQLLLHHDFTRKQSLIYPAAE